MTVEVDDALVQVVMERHGLRTPAEAVDLALRVLAGQPMSREEALAMRGAHAIDETPGTAGP
jgi:Arc/MetJ family transcription regulator